MRRPIPPRSYPATPALGLTFWDYELVVDGSDNFDTRDLVNGAGYLAGKANVHGFIFQFDGMATVLVPNQGAFYRCLYPDPSSAQPRYRPPRPSSCCSASAIL